MYAFMMQIEISLKNGVFWGVTPVALVRTDVLDELSTSFI
jgi:hypothetical protein